MGDPDLIAWEIALLSVQPTLPTGYKVVLKKSRMDGVAALTAVSERLKTITVLYDPQDTDLPDLDELDDRIGSLTSTFVHELSLHGNILGLDPDLEHDKMFDPEHRKIYLDACFWALGLMSNSTQREAFVDEWKKDMNLRLEEYVERHFPLFNERKKWIRNEARKMHKMIKEK